MTPTLRAGPVESSDFAGTSADGNELTGLAAVSEQGEIFDDDSVIVPALDASDFVRKPKTTSEARAKIAEKKQLEFRRMLIPILLTMGLLMFFFASLRFVLSVDSPLSVLPIWLPILLLFGGCIFLAFAVMNMLSVKAQLSRDVR